MLKTDAKELKKHISKAPKEDGVIRFVYGLYRSPSDGKVWENVWNYSMLEDDMKHRLAQIFGKALKFSGSGSGTSVPVSSDSEAVLAMRNVKNDIRSFSTAKDAAIGHIASDNPYCLFLAQVVYDVPKKAEDNADLDESEDVYTAILGAVCPAKLSAPSLGYDHDAVEELSRRWTISGSPALTFLYPSFSNRMEDRGEVFLADKADHTDFLSSFFDFSGTLETEEEQKAVFQSTLENMNLKAEEVAAFHESLHEISNSEEAPEILDKGTFVRAAQDAGIDGVKASKCFQAEMEGHSVKMENASGKKTTFKTGEAVLTVPSDAAETVSVKNIDGIHYLMVAVDGSVTVNGVETVL